LATLLIVVNTIRLTVLARQAEIEIMRLVGATNSFIRWPFIVEGILIGIIGGSLSLIVLKLSYEAVTFRLLLALPFLPVIANKGILTFIYSLVGVMAVFLGSLGGYLSVSKILKD
jgi:cell division transport system permease protein